MRADELFLAALDTVKNASQNARSQAYLEIAESELSLGKRDAAKATLQLFVEAKSVDQPWSQLDMLLRSAILAKKMGDDVLAHNMFDQAIEKQKTLNELNQSNGFRVIAEAQATAGDIKGAMKTASRIKCFEKKNGFFEG